MPSTVLTDMPEIVEVLYALPERQTIVEIAFEPGLTAGLAVERSRLVERYPEIAEGPLVLGVWGVEAAPELELKAGDRVEISRPLVADPRDMRREFLSGGRVMGGARAPDPSLRKKSRA